MEFFTITVHINTMKFKRIIPGNRSRYSDEEFTRLYNNEKAFIEKKLSALGYISN